MPWIVGACWPCRKLVQHFVPKIYARGRADLVTLLRGGVLRCDCDGPLEGEGSRTFEVLQLEVEGQQVAAAIALGARPTARSRIVGLAIEDSIERTIVENNARRAQDLAHRARRLHRFSELTWDFDTDASGQPLEERRNGARSTGQPAGVQAERLRAVSAGDRDVRLRGRARERRPDPGARDRPHPEARADSVPVPRRPAGAGRG